MHRLWKDEFVSMLGISAGCDAGSPPPKVLDVAGGTGDIAFRSSHLLLRTTVDENIRTVYALESAPNKTHFGQISDSHSRDDLDISRQIYSRSV